MSETTKIEWCDATFNPWIGCTKVSPGCAHCYAEQSTPSRTFGVEWGKGKERWRTSVANWELPRRWNRKAGAVGTPRPTRPRVFCASLADWLDDEVPIEWLADLLKLIHETPNLDWLLLTKRPGKFRTRLDAAGLHLYDNGMRRISEWALQWFDAAMQPPNVWFGVSVEDQARAEERIPQLLKIPARVRFLSVEPLLGPVDLWSPKFSLPTGGRGSAFNWGNGVNWVIVGGESGAKARPCHVEWLRSIRDECKAAEVACFVKQLGSRPLQECGHPCDEQLAGEACPCVQYGGCELKLRHSKGGDMEEWPEDLRVREFPRFDVQSSKLDVGSS